MQQSQQLWDGRDLVALAIDFALAQQQSHVCSPGADHVQRPGCIALAAAAHALAVDRHRALHLAGHLRQPLLAGQLQLPGIEQAKHPRKSIVRGNATGQWHKAGKPVLVLFAELGYFHPVVRSCDGGAQRNSQDRLQFVTARALYSRVRNSLQVLQQTHRNGAWRVTQAL